MSIYKKDYTKLIYIYLINMYIKKIKKLEDKLVINLQKELQTDESVLEILINKYINKYPHTNIISTDLRYLLYKFEIGDDPSSLIETINEYLSCNK